MSLLIPQSTPGKISSAFDSVTIFVCQSMGCNKCVSGCYGVVEAGYLFSHRALILVWGHCSTRLGDDFQLTGHTNGQGASNPGAPCSPFSPLGPFLPFFPFSPCEYNGLVKLKSFFEHWGQHCY